jgi:hypothetical protein
MRPLFTFAFLGALLATPTQQGTSFSVAVSPASVDVRGDTVRIAYKVSNPIASTGDLFLFTVDAPAPALRVERPARATGWHINTAKEFGRSVASWGFIDPTLVPGHTAPPLAFSALGLPGVVRYWAEPFTPPDTVEPPDVAASGDSPGGPGNSAADSWVTVGVVPFPADRSRVALLARLGGLLRDACARGWVDSQGVCTSLEAKIQHGDSGALLNELEAQRGKHVNDLAYFLLVGNVRALPVS